MMKRAVGILTAIAMLIAVPTLFAADTANDNTESDLSLMFLDTSLDIENGMIDSNEWEAGTFLPTSQASFSLKQKLGFSLQADDEGNVESVSIAVADVTGDKLNPGRALMLSAIVPGAGELYAGSKIKAALFFGLEVACWYGAISNAQKGNDVEKDFELYADANYKEDYYRHLEYFAATNPATGTDPYLGDKSAWENETWQDRTDHLPKNFTHELPETNNQQYYESIGKYLTQFGWGWGDWIGSQSINDVNTAAANHTIPYDWLDYINEDYSSYLVNGYIDMRAESNDFLDKSAMFFSIVMVNHVVSAMDAGFTVRSKNKKLATIEPQVGSIFHNNQPVMAGGLRVRF
jgi:Family of unknown function (DUF5683)